MTTNENDKDIKIETGEDVGLDDKIKTGARALGKKVEDPDRDTGSIFISLSFSFVVIVITYS